MRHLKGMLTVLVAVVFLAPAALAQDTPGDEGSPVEDLPVLGNLEGEAQPDVPAQPDLEGQTADEGDAAPAPASAAAETGDGEAILPVTGTQADVLAGSGAGLLTLGSVLLLVRRLRGSGGLLRELLWAAD